MEGPPPFLRKAIPTSMPRPRKRRKEGASRCSEEREPGHVLNSGASTSVVAPSEGKEQDTCTTASASNSKVSSAPRGNFSSYYHIRKDIRRQTSSATGQCDDRDGEPRDARVHAITTWLNKHRRIGDVQRRRAERYLDVGCNSGQVTLELATYLEDEPSFVVGVDVDKSLLARAKQAARRQGYNDTVTMQDQSSRSKSTLGVRRVGYSAHQPRKRLQIGPTIEELGQRHLAAFLLCDWVYNDRAAVSLSRGEGSEHHQTFGILDGAEVVAEQDHRGYDLITALSVTKWIHLVHYDDGLRRFFARICQTLRPGGILVLEPQPYKSYQGLHKVTGVDSQERKNWKAIRVMPDDFPWILSVELGLVGPCMIRERGEHGK